MIKALIVKFYIVFICQLLASSFVCGLTELSENVGGAMAHLAHMVEPAL